MQEAKRAGVAVDFEETALGGAHLRDGASALQILVNLLLNAIAFSPPGATVTLSAEDRTETIGFRVADQGPGVPAERADSLLSGPSSTRRGGAGIGLTHSAALACDKGGRLRLAQPGPGAVFELTWPVVEDRSGPYERLDPGTSLEGTRVVVVEDDANVLSLVEMALEAHGVQVMSVTCPEDLVDLLANGQTFDAAFVDFSPFENEAAQPALEALTRSVTNKGIILISGLVRPVPPVLEVKVAQWVRKPFEMSELVVALRRVVGG
jgi:CheY-like chemotaxis protein